MDIVKIDVSKTGAAVSDEEMRKVESEARSALELLHSGKGAGSDFLGWVELPSETTPEFLNEIKRTAEDLRSKADVIIVIGIGGSYLGAKAVLEAMSNSFAALNRQRTEPVILFAGQTLNEDYTYELMEAVKDYSIAAIVISKSGTTTEPAIAFRIVKAEIERRYGVQEAAGRIVAITDSSRGALKGLATEQGYRTFVIPDNVGGRFSVLTPVGLLPLAVAGVDIEALISGAQDMQKQTSIDVPSEQNVALRYAAIRNALYRKGYKVELLASYEPKLQYFAEWWKQLYGESEGKDGKGIFPASVIFSTDLHSMGQYIQDGERMLFETVVNVVSPKHKVTIEKAENDADKLNFLAGKRVGEVNRMAQVGTTLAHVDGGVPNIRIDIPEINEYYIGALLYFFEKACGISGYVLGVNPFDQPGVEAYKKNMFALLDKPGYEEQSKAIKKRLAEEN